MKCHLLARDCDADILMMCGDDAEFKTKGWDDALRSCYTEWPDGIWCASMWDGSPGKESESNPGRTKITHPHPAIGREAFEVLGYVANPMFHHFCTDPWLTKMFMKIDRFAYFPKVQVNHHRAGWAVGVPLDDTYRRLRKGKGEMSSRDRTVESLLKRYRDFDAERLRDAKKEG